MVLDTRITAVYSGLSQTPFITAGGGEWDDMIWVSSARHGMCLFVPCKAIISLCPLLWQPVAEEKGTKVVVVVCERQTEAKANTTRDTSQRIRQVRAQRVPKVVRHGPWGMGTGP